MKGAVFLGLGLLVALATASPLTLERQKNENKPLSIVDVPAGAFDEDVKPEESKPSTAAEPEVKDKDASKDVEIVDTDKPSDEAERPTIFGFKMPTILIIRRPPMFQQDPFAGFQNPFFGGFNRRPIFSAPRPSLLDPSEEDVVKEREPLSGQDSKIEEQLKQNETIVVKDVIQRMHQQINNLFANLFNPETFYMPRPSFSRPPSSFFSRPSFFGPSDPSNDSDEAVGSDDFGNLPPNYSNTTSETKIIDGQVVTVNKTVHRISGNNSNGFFQFSVIKVRPENPKKEEEVKPAEASEVLPIAVAEKEEAVSTPVAVIPEKEIIDPSMNEVDRVEPEKDKVKYEIDVDSHSQGTENQEKVAEEEVKIVPIPVMSEKLILGNENDKGNNKGFTDLSSDIRVNNLMENSNQARVRALFDPEEVEVFEV